MSEELNKSEREELEALRKKNNKELSLKVSAKGGVSLYGLGRFPVTLYKGQWEKLIKFIGKIEIFLIKHDGELSVK